MNKADKYLKSTLQEILFSGEKDKNPRPKYKDGTPAHTKFITQQVFQYNISLGEFPIPTIRQTAIKMGIKEILWIYQKQSSKLSDGVHWWKDWNVGDGTVGLRYGATVGKYNIINELLYNLEVNPFGRRHIIDLYQYADFKETRGLYPCAFNCMFSVREGFIDLTLTLRSSDFIVAGFINQIQYVALLMMICGHLEFETGREHKPGKFMCVIQNAHIYDRHDWAVKEILERKPLEFSPKIELKDKKNFYEYTLEDFKITVPKIEKLIKELELAI